MIPRNDPMPAPGELVLRGRRRRSIGGADQRRACTDVTGTALGTVTRVAESTFCVRLADASERWLPLDVVREITTEGVWLSVEL